MCLTMIFFLLLFCLFFEVFYIFGTVCLWFVCGGCVCVCVCAWKVLIWCILRVCVCVYVFVL